MKTITYNELLYRAAEAAGRTRDNIPTPESTLLKSSFALDLPKIWNGFDWNELIPDPVSVTVADRAFSKNEGDNDEMGDILGVYTVDPRTTSKWVSLEFHEGDNTVRLPPQSTTLPDTVFVEYMLPCTDILAIAAGDLGATTFPLKFAGWLAERGAAQLLTADGDTGLAGAHFGLAESALASEAARITRPLWRRTIRYRR